jgi:hypothetical protein
MTTEIPARPPTHSQKNKALLDYINLRITQLKNSKSTEKIKRIDEKRREIIRRQIRGRILELVHMKRVIANGDYEKESVLIGTAKLR